MGAFGSRQAGAVFRYEAIFVIVCGAFYIEFAVWHAVEMLSGVGLENDASVRSVVYVKNDEYRDVGRRHVFSNGIIVCNTDVQMGVAGMLAGALSDAAFG